MREHAYAVYMMTDSRRGVLYVGVTSNLVSRAQQHR
ncbi:MAG: excinuclease ABC subunit C, partial [Caulobacter sp. 35-67-4]